MYKSISTILLFFFIILIPAYFSPPVLMAGDFDKNTKIHFSVSALCTIALGSSGVQPSSALDEAAVNLRSAVFCLSAGVVKELFVDVWPSSHDYATNLVGVVFGYWINRQLLFDNVIVALFVPAGAGGFRAGFVLHFF